MIREFIKGLLCLIILAGGAVTFLAWAENHPAAEIRHYRLIAPAATAIAFAAFLAIHFRRDHVPDFLHATIGRYFDRAGFCFSFVAEVEDGHFVLQTYFQNRFARPCRGRIALRPSKDFFLTRSHLNIISCDIACEGGAFGYVRLRLPIPLEFQGTRQSFDVGASVTYPNGRGKRLRNREGIPIKNNSSFGHAFGNTLAFTASAIDTIAGSHPARYITQLPREVATEIPDSPPEIKTLWKLGDPQENAATVSADSRIITKQQYNNQLSAEG